MTPLDKVFMLDIESRLDISTLTSVAENGHSRVPVYEGDRNNIVSCLYMKDLALVNPEEGIPLRSFLTFYGRQIPKIKSDKTLDFVLTEFKSGKSHMAVVQRCNGANSTNDDNVGIATMEDVLEEILQDEIMDEDDVRPSNGFRDIILKGSSQVNPQQLKAVHTYLASTLPEFSTTLISEDAFKYLVTKSEVKLIDKPSKNDEPLYQRNTPSPYFTLILQGKVEIQSGVEGFRSEGGPFTYLGLNAIKSDNFVPDFTARVKTGNVQLLRIKKKQYEDALHMTRTALAVRKPSVGKSAEPKNFMESTEFLERRRLETYRARSPVNIALKDLSKKSAKEEKMSLIEADAEDDNTSSSSSFSSPFSDLAATASAVVNSAFASDATSNNGASSSSSLLV